MRTETRDRLLAGEAVTFDPRNTADCRVDAALLRQAIVTSGRLELSNAEIAGVFDIQFESIRGDVILTDCTFNDSVNLSNAEFRKHVTIRDTRFKQGLRLRGAQFRYDVKLISGIVEGESADFREIHAYGSCDLNAVNFVCTTVNFEGARFDAIVLFRSVFSGKAIFTRMHARESATFEGAVFSKEAIFNGARIDGGAFFQGTNVGPPEDWVSSAIFQGPADFTKAAIGGQLSMQGVRFRSKVSFNGIAINGSVLFQGQPSTGIMPAAFDDEVDFRTAQILGAVDFRGAVFKGKATFNSLHVGKQFHLGPRIQGDVIGDAAHFESDVDFTGAEFGKGVGCYDAVFDGTVNFSGSTFAGEAGFDRAQFNGPVLWYSARFTRGANFTNTVFRKGAAFSVCEFDGLAYFATTSFHDHVSFRDSHFRSAHFSADGKVDDVAQFLKGVDWRGCTYTSFQADWTKFAAQVVPYERNVFVRLESFLREAGEDQTADTVYLICQRRERAKKFEQGDYIGWFWNWLYRIGAYYGIRPYRLALLAALILILGMAAFRDRNTVVFQRDEDKSGATGIRSKWSLIDAFGVSLHQFLPIDVPLGSDWRPIDVPVVTLGFKTVAIRPSIIATVLRISGWLLIPLGVAALTGLLKRKT